MLRKHFNQFNCIFTAAEGMPHHSSDTGQPITQTLTWSQFGSRQDIFVNGLFLKEYITRYEYYEYLGIRPPSYDKIYIEYFIYYVSIRNVINYCFK